MTWSFEIEVGVKLPDQVIIGGAPVRLRINPARLSPAKIAGKVEFECRNPPDVLADFGAAAGPSKRCCCKMFDLVEDGPEITQELGVDAYETDNDLLNALQVLPQLPAGFKVAITPPTAQLETTMRLVATNDGRCYNVRIDCSLTFVPAALVLSVPPIPVAGAVIPVSDLKYQIGSEASSRYTTQYRLCCCTWHTGYDELVEFNPETETAEPIDETFSIPIGVDCTCGGFSAAHLRERKVGGGPIIRWMCRAEEGPCEWTVVSVGPSELRKKRGGRSTIERGA